MRRSTVIMSLAVALALLMGQAALADSVALRPGGGTGYTDVVMDDTYAEPANTTVYGTGDTMFLSTNSAGAPQQVGLMGWATLFSVVPATSGGDTIVIDCATLHLTAKNGSNTPYADTVTVVRMTTQWLTTTAGTNESNVNGKRRDITNDLPWAAGSGGSIGSGDWTTANSASFAGNLGWLVATDVNITALMRDLYASGVNAGFAFIASAQTGTSSRVSMSEGSLGYRPVLTITYHYVPVAPSGLAASAVSSSEIDLSWTDNSNDESTFRIERKTGSGGAYAEIGTAGANATTYADNTCSPETQYYYRVRARTAGGTNSDYSNEANATTPSATPAAPSNLAATAAGTSEIDLTWTDNSNNETTFRIERKTGSGGTYAEIGTVNANVTSYADTTCSAETTYYYRVRARSSSGVNSNYSNEANATTQAVVPTTPSNLSATTVDAAEIDLSWTDNSNNEATFRVERKTGAGGTYAEIGTVAANVTAYADMTCSPSTAYYYRVRARTAGGTNSSYSNEANATTSAPSVANLRMGGGGGYTDATADDTYTEYWNTTSNGTLIRMLMTSNNVRIERYGLLGWADLFTLVPPASGGKAIIIDSAVLHLTSSNGGTTPYADTVKVARMTTPWLTGAAGTNQNNVNGQQNHGSAWAGGAAIGSADYTLTNAASVAGNLSWATPFTVDVTAMTQDLYTSGVNAGFVFFVPLNSAAAEWHTGIMSSEQSLAYRPALEIHYHYQYIGTPSAPSGLSATAVKYNEIDLAWTDNSNNETTFRIERKTGSGGTYAEIGSVGANVTAYADCTCSPLTTYYYRVRARTIAGTNSDYSNEDNATTPENPTPSDLSAAAVSYTEIDLTWADHSSDEATFRIERKTGSGGTYAEIGSVGANVTAYADCTCSPLTQYYYRVRARTSGGVNSDYSNEANATTPSADTPAGFYDWSTSTGPHSRHIVMEFVDYNGSRPPAEYDWVVGHYDWVFGEAKSEYKGRTPAPMWGGYMLILTVIQTGDDLGNNYYPDMQTWYAAHPQYNIENAFLHKSGVRMTKPIWGSPRWIINPGDPGLIEYDKDRLSRFSGSDDFVFVDEYGSGEINTYDGSDEYPVLANLQNDEVSLLSTLRASLGKRLQINTAQYLYDLDKRCVIAAGGVRMELTNNPLAENNAEVWTFQEACLNGGALVGALSPWTFDDIDGMSGFPLGNELSKHGRMRMGELASYYMVVPSPCAMMTHAYHNGLQSDWIKSIEVNVGAPQAARYVYQSGTDGRGKAYTIYARDFDKALVIYRPAKAWNDKVWDNTTAVTVNLPGVETWKQVRSDGTLATSFVTSVSLLQAEAVIMMKGSKLGTPAAPAKLAATAVSSSRIDLAWLDYSSDESTFRIERKIGSGGTYSEIGTVSSNVTTYSDTTCSSATTYYYRVRSRTNAGVNSSYSNEDHATTP